MNPLYKTIILDDEPAAIDSLKNKLFLYFPNISVIETCLNELEFFSALKQAPDILFLDIELGGGKTIFNLLEKMPYHAYNIVFNTGHDQYMHQAFKVSCINYIKKSSTADEFKIQMQNVLQKIEYNMNTAMQVLLHNLKEPELRKQKFSVKTNDGYVPVNNCDIHYIATKSGEQKVVTFYLSDKTRLLEKKNIGEIEERLFGNPFFFRIHQSTIVSIYGIEKIKKHGKTTYVYFKNDRLCLSVSEKKDKQFWHWYKTHTI